MTMNLNESLYNSSGQGKTPAQKVFEEQLVPAFRRIEEKLDKSLKSSSELEEKLNRAVVGVERNAKQIQKIIELLEELGFQMEGGE